MTPQYKFLLLRLIDREADVSLRSEFSSIPIVGLEYPLLKQTTLRAGLQGFGSLPHRLEDRKQMRRSFEQRTTFISLTNRTGYFGYDLYTIIGFEQNKKEFEDPFRRADGFNTWSVFVRSLIGFTEYGRLL